MEIRRRLAPVVLAGLRERVVPDRSDAVTGTFARLSGALSGQLGRAGVVPVGPAWQLYHRAAAGLTVAAAQPVPPDAVLPTSVERVELPADGSAWTVHPDGGQDIGAAWRAVLAWMEARPARRGGACEVSLIVDAAELQIVVTPAAVS